MVNAQLHQIAFSGLENIRYSPSPIHGTGSFATRKIHEGEGVFLPWTPEDQEVFINHADSPNCARSKTKLWPFALRDIQEGEEITEDYRLLRLFDMEVNFP